MLQPPSIVTFAFHFDDINKGDSDIVGGNFQLSKYVP
jgi:hypothetical protein